MTQISYGLPPKKMRFSPAFRNTKKAGHFSTMKTKRPVAATHYFNRSRWDVINELTADNWGWEFLIGVKHIGAQDFRNEFPEFDIIAEYRPSARDRKSRYAIYGRQLLF